MVLRRWNLKIWERIAEEAQKLPPEKQQEVLDFVEFVAGREGPASTPRVPDASGSWPGFRIAAEEQEGPREPGSPFGMDTLRMRRERRRGGWIAVAVLAGAVLLSVAGVLYYHFGRNPDQAADAVVAELDTEPPRAAFAEPFPRPADVGLTGTPSVAAADAGSASGVAAEEAVSTTIRMAPAEAQDGGAEAGGSADPGTATELEAGLAPQPAPACGSALDEARDLWRRRDREGALQKLRDAFACDPQAVEPRLQWGRWTTDAPSLLRDRADCAELAAAFRSVADANPGQGELWFYYTNLLFRCGQADDAQAAKEHCTAIRPRDDFVASCRFLPL